MLARVISRIANRTFSQIANRTFSQIANRTFSQIANRAITNRTFGQIRVNMVKIKPQTIRRNTTRDIHTDNQRDIKAIRRNLDEMLHQKNSDEWHFITVGILFMLFVADPLDIQQRWQMYNLEKSHVANCKRITREKVKNVLTQILTLNPEYRQKDERASRIIDTCLDTYDIRIQTNNEPVVFIGEEYIYIITRDGCCRFKNRHIHRLSDSKEIYQRHSLRKVENSSTLHSSTCVDTMHLPFKISDTVEYKKVYVTDTCKNDAMYEEFIKQPGIVYSNESNVQIIFHL